MAVIKHISVKGSNGGDALNYVLYKHNEKTGEMLVDGRGNPIMRDEYYLDGINCEPYSFDAECKDVNDLYGKNQLPSDIKAHHFIISYDPKDGGDYGLSGPKAQQLSMEWAERCLPGFQMIVCTHMDGSNESGNIHTHIMMNSVRKYDTDPTTFGERDIDHMAGYKLHLTDDYLRYMKKELMSICDREGLHQVDLLSLAKDKITDKEYYAHKHGQDYIDNEDKHHDQEKTSSIKADYQTKKQYIREAVKEVASRATSFDVFCDIIKEQYGVTVKESRGRISYLHPETEKYITGRSLGSDYEKDSVLMIISGERIESQVENSQATYLTGDIPSKIETMEDCQKVFVMHTELKLVAYLQDIAKAQTSAAYANDVTLSNVKSIAETILFVQRNGFKTVESIDDEISKTKKEYSEMNRQLSESKKHLRELNETIHYMGQYLANKSIYQSYIKNSRKTEFKKVHKDELGKYSKAIIYLRTQYCNRPFPELNSLKEERKGVSSEINECYRRKNTIKGKEKQLKAASRNIKLIVGEKNELHITSKQKQAQETYAKRGVAR